MYPRNSNIPEGRRKRRGMNFDDLHRRAAVVRGGAVGDGVALPRRRVRCARPAQMAHRTRPAVRDGLEVHELAAGPRRWRGHRPGDAPGRRRLPHGGGMVGATLGFQPSRRRRSRRAGFWKGFPGYGRVPRATATRPRRSPVGPGTPIPHGMPLSSGITHRAAGCSGQLYADCRGNAVFVLVAGKANRPVGAELRGTGPRVGAGIRRVAQGLADTSGSAPWGLGKSFFVSPQSTH